MGVMSKTQCCTPVVLGRRRPWSDPAHPGGRGRMLTIVLVEDGGAVVQHFVILLGHQLALTVVEQQRSDLLIQLNPVRGSRLFLAAWGKGEGNQS